MKTKTYFKILGSRKKTKGWICTLCKKRNAFFRTTCRNKKCTNHQSHTYRMSEKKTLTAHCSKPFFRKFSTTCGMELLSAESHKEKLISTN